MKIRLTIAAFFVAVFFSISAAAGLDAIVNGLQRKYEKVYSVSADFTQEVASKGLGKTQTSKGRVYFKKPGKMRWVYTGPGKDELISDGKTLWVWQPDLNQVLERPAEGAGARITTDFLSGVGDLKKDFNIALVESGPGTYRLALTPKDPLPNVKKIFLDVDAQTLFVIKTEVADLFGNVTKVSFTNLKVNPEIKDAFFEFKPPKGAQVIKP